MVEKSCCLILKNSSLTRVLTAAAAGEGQMYRGRRSSFLHPMLLLLLLTLLLLILLLLTVLMLLTLLLLLTLVLLQLLPAYPAAAAVRGRMRKGHCTCEGHINSGQKSLLHITKHLHFLSTISNTGKHIELVFSQFYKTR